MIVRTSSLIKTIACRRGQGSSGCS